jgi:hypothetical protein
MAVKPRALAAVKARGAKAPRKGPAASDVLGVRELNRATLARQMLLAREETTALLAVERLVGLQAQLARPPFLALWSRLVDFQAEELTRLVHDRKLVRGTLMRGTLHLVSARDFRLLRPAVQASLTEGLFAILRDRMKAIDIEGVSARARTSLLSRPQTFEELRTALRTVWPKLDERAMGYTVRMHLPLVQVPDSARWGWPASSSFALAESWLGAPLPAKIDLAAVVLRFLAAFGPASPRDAQTFLGMRDLAPVFEALREQLRTFRDEKGRELFDLPEAPRPPADTPAPVRFLPDFDNVLLAYAERARIISDAHRPKVATANLRVLPAFLLDGFVAGTWKIVRSGKKAALVLDPFETLQKKVRAELFAEGEALLRFAEQDAQAFDVRLA